MPKTYLWSLDSNGFVYYISTWDEYWSKLDSPLSKIQKFKKIAASQWCIWAIGYDDEVYIFVQTSDAPIRVVETIVESQRKGGGIYNNKNLKSDDPPDFGGFNSLGKLIKVDFKNYKLPSTRWSWENDWQIKHVHESVIAQDEGWLYSQNFNQPKQMEILRPRLSFAGIRQRHWQRYRYFSACDRWLLIGQKNEEFFEVSCSQQDSERNDTDVEKNSDSGVCFIDISCGGEMLPYQKDGYISIWAIDHFGRVIHRLNVYRLNPEGINWCIVKLPNSTRASNISVGPLGQVMVCCDDGKLYFREGITWKNVIGTFWKIIDLPTDLKPNENIIQVSLAIYSIWLRSNLNRLWCRENVNLHLTESDIGVGNFWLLVGNIAGVYKTITTSATGQLWALRDDSVKDGGGDQICSNSNKLFYRLSNKYKFNQQPFWSGNLDIRLDLNKDSYSRLDIYFSDISASGLYLDNFQLPLSWTISPKLLGDVDQIDVIKCCHQIIDLLVARDYREYKNPYFSHFTTSSEQVSWSKASDCEASSNSYDINSPYKWLPGTVTLHHKVNNESKDRATIHVQPRQFITTVSHKQLISFVNCADIICVTKAETKLSNMYYNTGNQCTTLLILMESKTSYTSPLHANCNIPQLLLNFKSESEVEDWILAINMAMQHASLSLSRKYQSRRLVNSDRKAKPFGNLWYLNQFHEPFVSRTAWDDKSIEKWNMDGGHFRAIESGEGGQVTWAIGFNGIAYAHNNQGYGGCYLGPLCSSKSDDLNMISDFRYITVIEYEKLTLLRGLTFGAFSPYMWIDSNRDIIRSKEHIQLASKRWSWDGDWMIDHQYMSNDGSKDNLCDADGWQYSADLNHKFDNKLTWNKKYRRRFWRRRYLTQVRGPWIEVINESIKIAELSIAPIKITSTSDINSSQHNKHNSYSVWAVTEEGDLLRRIGVNANCPEGRDWLHIKTSNRIFSLSINSQYTLWTVCDNGHLWRLKVPVNALTSTQKTLADEDWDIVRHPNQQRKFIMCSTGDNRSLWAIDDNFQLWTRQFNEQTIPLDQSTNDVIANTPSTSGLSWLHIEDRVLHISCHSLKRVWVLFIIGNVAERTGISLKNPRGVSWNYKIRGVASYISCRGGV